MREFLGVFHYEYRMSIRRWSLWLVFGLLIVPYLTAMMTPPDMVNQIPSQSELLSFAGTMAFMLNLFMPVVGGILVADRLVRDQKFGVDELLQSTPLKRRTYLAGKYLGALCSIATPVLLGSLLLGISLMTTGVPAAILPAMLLTFLGMNLPAYMFVTAYSLACPLVIPVRVYQVLFTGYWFWGNYLSPTVMPTLNGTYLTPNGEFVLAGFFGGFYQDFGPVNGDLHSALDASINLGVLFLFTALALFCADRYLAWRARRA